MVEHFAIYSERNAEFSVANLYAISSLRAEKFICKCEEILVRYRRVITPPMFWGLFASFQLTLFTQMNKGCVKGTV